MHLSTPTYLGHFIPFRGPSNSAYMMAYRRQITVNEKLITDEKGHVARLGIRLAASCVSEQIRAC